MRIKDIAIALFASFDYGFDGNYTVERKEELNKMLNDAIDMIGANKRDIMCCMRLILTGSANGLPVSDIMSYIGKQETMDRVRFAINRLG